MNNTIEQCESCGAEGQAYGLVNGKLTCNICHEPMVDKPIIPINAVESQPEALVDSNKAIPALSLDEMKQNTERAKKEFETLEGRLNKVRQQKLQAVEADDNAKVFSLSKEDVDLSVKLNEAYSLWQTAKKNHEYALTDRENLIIAEGMLTEHDSKVNERAASANILLNFCSELNAQIDLVLDVSLEFKTIQQKGLNDSERFCMWLKQNHIGRIGEVDLQQLREDNYGAIVPIKQSLSKEVGLLENGLSKIEGIIANIRKGIYPSLMRRGD